MSIEFDGSTDYFELSGASVTSAFTAYPFSMFCYYYLDAGGLTANQVPISFADVTDAAVRKYQLVYHGAETNYREWAATSQDDDVAGDPTFKATHNANAFYTTQTDWEDSPPTAATWYWVAAIYHDQDSVSLVTSHKGYTRTRKSSVDGGIPYITAADTIRVGARGNNTLGAYFDGRMAHVALFTGELGHRDIHQLILGALPTDLSPNTVANIFDYWDFAGVSGSAGNQTGINGNVLTANGTPVYAANPTISGRGTATISVTLTDASGTPIPNQSGLRWWFYSNTTPASIANDFPLPAASGSGATTDGNGVFSVTSITGVGVAASQTGYLIITNSDGTPTSPSLAGAIPVTLS